MLEQCRFDLKKNLRSSTNVVIFAALVILLLGSFFTAISTTDSSRFEVSQAYAATGVSVDNTIKILEKQKHPSRAVKRQLARKYTQREYIQDILSTNAGVTSPVPMNKPVELNRALLAYAKYNLKETAAGRSGDLALINVPGKATQQTLLARKQDVAFYTYLVKHRLTELPVAKANAPAAAYLPFQLLYHLSPLVLLAVIVVQLGQLFTTEKREGTVRFLNTVPVSKLKLLTARMVTFLTLTVPLVLAACAVVYVLTGVKFGWGSWQYPLVYAPDAKHVAIMTMSQYLLAYGGLMLSACVFLMMLSALLSLLNGNFAVNVIGLGATLLVATPAVLGTGLGRVVARWLPCGYFDFSQVILHQTAWPLGSITAGVGVTLAWAAALYGVCLVVLNRREQL